MKTVYINVSYLFRILVGKKVRPCSNVHKNMPEIMPKNTDHPFNNKNAHLFNY